MCVKLRSCGFVSDVIVHVEVERARLQFPHVCIDYVNIRSNGACGTVRRTSLFIKASAGPE